MNDFILETARRIVTDVNGQGRSHVMIDAEMTNVQTLDVLPGFRWIDLWNCNLPAENAAKSDLARGDVPVFPEMDGCVFRIFEIDPDAEEDRARKSSGDTHPGMNAEATLDFIFVIEGEIHVVFEDGEKHMKKGDYLIQQGTRHAWSNRSDKPCRMLAVLVGGKLGT